MKYNIRGEKLVVTNAIKNYIEEKISKLDKYFHEGDNFTANVLLKTRGKEEIIEVTIPATKYTLRAEERHPDLYAAIDLVSDKLERQLRKNKTRLENKAKANKTVDFLYDYEVAEEEIETGVINKRKRLDGKPFDEEEAILQMELLGHDFFVFRDATTDSVSVLYKKKDGNYGIIETD